jgi:Beta-lactamase
MIAALMDDFPPAPDRLVTLSNWRRAPFSAWGFRNVRRLIPTANIAASRHVTGLEMSLQEIGQVGFNGHDGNPTTVNQALRATDTGAFVVLRRGRLAMEWYGNGMSAATPHIVFSVSKSICGTLGGILADRGLLDPDDRVIDYIPELASSVYAGCTIRHLLDMSVGIAFSEDYEDPKGDVMRYRHAAGGIRCRRAKRRSICAAFSASKSPTEQSMASCSIMSRPTPTCSAGSMSAPATSPMPTSQANICGRRLAPSKTPISPSTRATRCAPPAASASRRATSPASAK